MFLHDAVLESLVCGNTQLPLHDLKRCMETLHRWDAATGKSGFQTQFQVSAPQKLHSKHSMRH